MKLGLIARMDNRGLGIQSWELFRHLDPRVTIGVNMLRVLGHVPGKEYPERFPGALIARYDGGTLEPYDEVLRALARCDVVLTVETPYDHRLTVDLRARGVRTALVGNREFLDWLIDPELPRPDLFIAPSEWKAGDWPANTVFLPHPVDRERLPFTQRTSANTFLHIAAPAMNDRAGTKLVLDAVQYLYGDVRCVVRSQHPLAHPVRHPRRVQVEIRDRDDYWDVYAGADVLVAPRRYGGQSLPVLEALSLGMPVIALDREPERSLLPSESLVPAQRMRNLHVSGGVVGLWNARPRDLADRMNILHGDDELVTRLSADAGRRAELLSWDTLGPRWKLLLRELAHGTYHRS